MLPPVMNGGIASSSSRRPQSAPIPDGPSILWPLITRKSQPSSRDVDGHVRRRLRGIDQHQRAGGVRHLDDLADRVDRPERVADLRDRQQARAGGQLGAQVVHVEQAVVGEGDVVERRPDLAGQLLPGNDVGVMLELGGEHPLAGAQVGAAPAVGHQVDRLGRVAHEHDLALRWRAEEGGDLAPRPLEPVRGVLAQLVDPAMDVRVVMGVHVRDRIDHRPAASVRWPPRPGRRAASRCRWAARRSGSPAAVRLPRSRSVSGRPAGWPSA